MYTYMFIYNNNNNINNNINDNKKTSILSLVKNIYTEQTKKLITKTNIQPIQCAGSATPTPPSCIIS